MAKKKYKILVLSDLKKSTSTVLKSTVSLAKMINGNIEFFHVKKPSEIVERESQLSAIRTINSEHNLTKKKIQRLLTTIHSDYGIKINYSFTFGNVKSEIDNYIDTSQPDVIVLGQRASRAFNISGDKIIDFILKKHKGVIMIAANENALEPDKELSLGILNGSEESFNMAFGEDLITYTQKPLKSYKIVKNSNALKETSIPQSEKTVEYVFEHGDNSIKNLSKYLSISNINLLCIERGKNNPVDNLITSDIKDIINNVNVSLMLSSKQTINLKN